MPLQATSGAASYDGFGGGVAAVPNYIEDVFSTWLIKPTGDYTNYSINNGIDLSTKGGMTWFKARDAAQNNLVYDTARGSSSGSPNALITNSTAAQQTAYFDYVTPNSNGFTVNYASGGGQLTNSGINYASWTFRKQPKFFDVVTYTGNGTTQNIAHSLGSTPGCIIVKRINDVSNWPVWHNSISTGTFLQLNRTNAAASDGGTIWGNNTTYVAPTSTQFTVGSSSSVNYSGDSYVAYLFAHNAGGFGLTGTDNVISCGSYVEPNNGSFVNVNLGYEPQWLLVKCIDQAATSWNVIDNMRGMVLGSGTKYLEPNTSNAESSGFANAYFQPTATGFTAGNTFVGGGGKTIIYIAIRRGPMKVPTSGTSVYATDTLGGSSGGTAVPAYRSPFPVDWAFEKRTNGIDNWIVNDRLRGINSLEFNLTDAEALYDSQYKMDFMNGWVNYAAVNANYRSWMLRRAPNFFDEVCYTGTGVARTINHNLGVAPELMIVKERSPNGYQWRVYAAPLGNTQALILNFTSAASTQTYWNNTTPTSTVFSVGTDASVNASGDTYVAYLFATCAGVSKVGSYTGTGVTQTINCGFTGGARFVLIKRTNTSGSWFVWDTARGMVSGTDPALTLNTANAEYNADSVYTTTGGFQILASPAEAINNSGDTYIYLAIA